MKLRNMLCIASLAVAAVIAAPAVRADSTAGAKKAIQAQYDKMNAAAARKDSKGILAIMTKDHTGVTQGGQTFTLDQETAQMQQIFTAAKSLNGVSKITSIALKGSTATVQVSETDKVVMPNPNTGKTSTMTMSSVSTDTWIKKGSVWLQQKSVQKSQKVSVDGKAVNVPG
jgi:hypothetical protein